MDMSTRTRYRHNSVAMKCNPMAILVGGVVYYLSGIFVGDVVIVEIVGDVNNFYVIMDSKKYKENFTEISGRDKGIIYKHVK
ncbi:hypothetical protein CDL15_Pgr021234 [Punica granatum]|uniref:Uncharacterized protein n=1 Tax=Punica granatum TaxID=22663 RepID=A0A218WQH9_PUNGR|nr:hypothetical protein CDL15_Pgr021234 [Punica granatum]